MQYLMVLLLIIGVVVLMVAAIMGLSYAIGAFMNSREGARAGPASTDPCAQCQADRDWYEELPIWKRNVVTAWWLVNRYSCAARGCR